MKKGVKKALSVKKVLSIDFDFFVDCRHVDSFSHLVSDRWKDPQSAQKMVPFMGPSFEEFLRHFDLTKTEFFACEESHKDIVIHLPLGHHALEILNVDSHHDIHYGGIDLADFIRGEFTCGSWGGFLMECGRVLSWTQVYPEWRKERPEVDFEHNRRKWADEKIPKPVKQQSLEEVSFAPDILFVCKSGVWVPSVYDEKFVEFCRLLTKVGRFQVPGDSVFRFSR